MKNSLNLILSLLLFHFLSTQVVAQEEQQKIDSLKTALSKKSSSDTLTVINMNKLARLLVRDNQFELAESYAQKALKLSEKLNYKKGKANSQHTFGNLFERQQYDAEAVKHFSAALKIWKEIGYKKEVAYTYYYIGNLHEYQGNYPEALKNFYTALKKGEEIGDKELIGLSHNGIGIVYGNQTKYVEALKNYAAALKIWEETDDIVGISECYNNMGLIYEFQGKYPEALENYFKCLEIKKQLGNKRGIAGVYNNIGSVYRQQEKHTEALENFTASLKIVEEIGEKWGIAMAHNNIGFAEHNLNQPVTAKSHFEKALTLAKELGRKELIRNVHNNLRFVEIDLGNYKEAYKNYEQYIIYRDSLINEENERKSLEASMGYEYDKKEAVIKAELETKNLELKTKNLQRNVAFAGLGIMALFALFVIYFLRLRNKNLKIEKENLELQQREVETIKQTEQFKSRFLANISHEFRTPLTLINGHLEVLKENGRKEDFSHYDEMEQNGKKLLNLINQLLDLSKMESGQYKLQYKKGNALNETSMLVQSFYSYAEQHGIELTVQPTENVQKHLDETPFVYSSEALAIITTNLVSNAIKYTPAGGNVKAIVDYRDDKLFVSISDTGTGIPKDHLPKIFDRFYQVDEPGQRAFAGSGIGLALVKELSVLHGGDVTVTSPEEGGCTFTFWIANHKTEENENASEVQQNTVFPVQEEIQILNDEHQNTELPLILIVEDQHELRSFIVQNLGNEYRYAEASNGKDGLTLAEELLPDLIISDVMMPDTDGFELCKTLKSNMVTSHIPIVLLTAKADQKDKLIGLETGADDYIVKPFSLAELKLRVKNILSFKELIRKKFEGNTIPTTDETPELNSRDRKFVDDLNQVVEENLSNTQLGINILAESVFLSVSQLTRKLKTLTGKTPAEFIRNIRFQKALILLKDGKNVTEAAWEVGFEDPVYFSKVFKKHFGFPPSSAKK